MSNSQPTPIRLKDKIAAGGDFKGYWPNPTLDIASKSEQTAISSNDAILVYDQSASVNKKCTIEQLEDWGKPQIQDFRLTIKDNTPVMDQNTIGAPVLYFTPFKGNRISLYTGITSNSGTWEMIEAAQVSYSLASTTNDAVYHVYAFNSNGLALELIQASTQKGSITNISYNGSNGATITSAFHGLTTSNGVALRGVGGMTTINGYHGIVSVTTNTFHVKMAGSHSAYTSGGTFYGLQFGDNRGLQDAVYVKGTDHRKRYVGSVLTNSNGYIDFTTNITSGTASCICGFINKDNKVRFSSKQSTTTGYTLASTNFSVRLANSGKVAFQHVGLFDDNDTYICLGNYYWSNTDPSQAGYMQYLRTNGVLDFSIINYANTEPNTIRLEPYKYELKAPKLTAAITQLMESAQTTPGAYSIAVSYLQFNMLRYY